MFEPFHLLQILYAMLCYSFLIYRVLSQAQTFFSCIIFNRVSFLRSFFFFVGFSTEWTEKKTVHKTSEIVFYTHTRKITLRCQTLNIWSMDINSDHCNKIFAIIIIILYGQKSENEYFVVRNTNTFIEVTKCTPPLVKQSYRIVNILFL